MRYQKQSTLLGFVIKTITAFTNMFMLIIERKMLED